MKISFENIIDMENRESEYVANAPQVYNAFQFVQSGYTEKRFFALYMKLCRLCDKYAGIAFEINYSKVESNGAYKRLKRNGNKVGRRKIIVGGRCAEPHVHATVIAVERGADIYSFQTELNKYLAKLPKSDTLVKRYKSSYIKANQRMSITGGVGCYSIYCRKQAQNTRRGGTAYNWKYFDDERFRIS